MALKLSALMASLLVIMSVFCYSFVLMNDKQHSLTDVENQLIIHQAKNDELKAELNAMVAGVDIEKYAVEKLGLIKVSAENEVYIKGDTSNKIVFSAKTRFFLYISSPIR